MNYRIRRVPIMRFGMVNAFVLQSDAGAILIDTGVPNSQNQVSAALGHLGLTLKDLKLIVVTHGHFDHAGGAAQIRKLSGAPVLIHEREAKYCAGEEKMKLCPTGWVGKLLYKSGAPQAPYDFFAPEITLNGDDRFDLKAYGLSGYITPTPGHTPGSVSVVMEDGQAFVSDLVASGLGLGGIIPTGVGKRPPFEEEPHVVARGLEELLSKGAQHFHLGHGFKLGRAAIERHIDELRKL